MSATNEVIKWVKEFVEVPHPVFADLPPCPYAKQARLDGKVEFVEVPASDPDSIINEHIDKFNFVEKDVLVLIFRPERWSVDETLDIADNLNETYKIQNILIMEDHPQKAEAVQDVKLNQGKYILFFVQSRTKVAKFEKMLRNTGYYKNWDSNYEKEVTGPLRHPVK